MAHDDHDPHALTAARIAVSGEAPLPLAAIPRPLPFAAPGSHAQALGAAMDRALALAPSALGTGDVEARRAELARMEALRVLRELSLRADARNVPAHPALRAVALAPQVERPTTALIAIERALSWRASTRRPGTAPHPLTVVLSGPPGVGKSTAAARVVTRWSRPARFVRAREVAALASWESVERNRLGSVPLLAVDEAGLEEGDRAGARIAGLLCERADQPFVTIVVTNLDAAAFRARYVDDRLASRLASQEALGCGWWEEIGGDDLRQVIA